MFSRRGSTPWIVALMLLAAGCGESGTPANTDPASAAGGESGEAPRVEAPKDDPLAKLVESTSGQLPELAFQGGAKAQGALREVLDKKPKKNRADRFRFRSQLEAAYGAGGSLHLLSGGKLTSAGQAALDAVQGADSHALDPAKFHAEELSRLLEKLDKVGDKRPDGSGLKLTAEEQRATLEAARGAGLQGEGPEARRALVKLLTGASSPVPRVHEAVKAWGAFEEEAAGLMAEAELVLADALLSYAWEVRYQNAAWFKDNAEVKAAREGKKTREADALIPLMGAAFKEHLESGDLTAWIDGLPPRYDQYPKLQKELERYRKIVAEGGWKEVQKANLRRGAKGKRVVELKERLAIEGYYPPPDASSPEARPFGESFDEDLERSVKLYQRTHQLKEDGEPDKIFWTSLNTPASERLQQIEINLRRWQKSGIGDDPYFILVNIPDFHAEGWKDGVREIRFRIVVGNNKYGCDAKTKKWKRVNATPLQSNAIQNVIYNPYWNIPTRIWQEELIPEQQKDPEYYAKHGYECVQEGSNRCARMRQKTGDGNALGRVKFIFPNEFGTYMHDTPKKHYFDYPVRAFSHGCMRVHNPLNFAEYLLKNDGQWDERRVEKILGRDTEESIRLKNPVPIHVEYYTVRVDDEGFATFAADVYRYDRAEITGEPESYRSCEPAEYVEVDEEGRAVVDEEDVDAMPEGAEGTIARPGDLEGTPAQPTASPAAGGEGAAGGGEGIGGAVGLPPKRLEDNAAPEAPPLKKDVGADTGKKRKKTRKIKRRRSSGGEADFGP